MTKSGYFESKKVRKQVRVVSRAITLEPYKDEAITIRNPNACCWYRVNAPAARPGRRFRVEMDAACNLVVAPAACQYLSLHSGAVQAVDIPITSEQAGARICFVCNEAGVWEVENATGIWTASNRTTKNQGST